MINHFDYLAPIYEKLLRLPTRNCSSHCLKRLWEVVFLTQQEEPAGRPRAFAGRLAQ